VVYSAGLHFGFQLTWASARISHPKAERLLSDLVRRWLTDLRNAITICHSDVLHQVAIRSSESSGYTR
jgi:hypothetical protein